MGVRFNSVASQVIQNALPASGAETLLLTSPPLTVAIDSALIIILVYLNMLAGTGTASITTLLRRGTTLAGLNINSGSAGITLAAGNSASTVLLFTDTPTAVAGQQYSFSITQNGATAAGTVREGCIIAFSL